MEISGISAATLASYTSAGGSPTASDAAGSSAGLEVQDEIILSVINQIQNQQQTMANGLIGMMQQTTIDIYA
jgi:3-oxoacyl-ACP reductase-like protein